LLRVHGAPQGTAFIPHGDTFYHLCSCELWVSRGNCPLCNGFIQEIFDVVSLIFFSNIISLIIQVCL
jgi:hypothetical protein